MNAVNNWNIPPYWERTSEEHQSWYAQFQEEKEKGRSIERSRSPEPEVEPKVPGAAEYIALEEVEENGVPDAPAEEHVQEEHRCCLNNPLVLCSTFLCVAMAFLIVALVVGA